MPKMTIRVILKSGVEFAIKCDKFTVTRNGFGQVTGYNVLPNTMSSLITSRLSPMTGISSLQNDNFPIDTRSRLPSSFKNVTSTGPFPVYNLSLIHISEPTRH